MRRRPPESLGAYDLVLRAMPHYRAQKPDENAEGIRLFMRAIELDPTYAPAISFAATALHNRLGMGWPAITEDDYATCVALTRRAIELANGDPMVLAQCGLTLAHRTGDYDEGLNLVQLAVAANPNNSVIMGFSAIAHLDSGDLTRAEEYAHRAVDLTPGRAGAYFNLTVISHISILHGDYEEALVWAERSLAVNHSFACTYWMLISANAKIGRIEEARRWVERFLAVSPDVTVAQIAGGSARRRHPERMTTILEGLRLAGLPES